MNCVGLLKRPKLRIYLLQQLMRTFQVVGELRPSQEPRGPLPDAQPRVDDRSHCQSMPAPEPLHCLGIVVRDDQEGNARSQQHALCLTNTDLA